MACRLAEAVRMCDGMRESGTYVHVFPYPRYHLWTDSRGRGELQLGHCGAASIMGGIHDDSTPERAAWSRAAAVVIPWAPCPPRCPRARVDPRDAVPRGC